jgi:hypothetical protein
MLSQWVQWRLECGSGGGGGILQQTVWAGILGGSSSIQDVMHSYCIRERQ